jgi:hypothetical protein
MMRVYVVLLWKKRHESGENGGERTDCHTPLASSFSLGGFYGPFCIYRATTTRNQYSILCVYLAALYTLLNLAVQTSFHTISDAGHDVRVKGAIERERQFELFTLYDFAVPPSFGFIDS